MVEQHASSEVQEVKAPADYEFLCVMTQEQVAAKMGISQPRVAQIEASAIAKMRKHSVFREWLKQRIKKHIESGR